ncbi:hypothetical protein V6N13_068308 [Hibiscus sabdariffa]
MSLKLNKQTRPALPILECLICSSDEDVLSNACWALSNLSDGTNDKIQVVIEVGVCPRLVELLLHPSPAVLSPAFLIVGNIAIGDDMQTQAVIDAGIIAPLVYLLRSSKLEIRKEAAWAISNATFSASLEQIETRLPNIVGSSSLFRPRIVVICLEALENILKASEARKKFGHSREANLYALLIDDVGGLEKIEILHGHGNNKIYEMAVKLHEKYWVGVSCYPPMMLCNLVSSLEAINFLIHPMDSILVEASKFDQCAKLKLDFRDVSILMPRLRLFRKLERLALIAPDGLNELRHKLLGYRLGDFWVPVGGIKKEDIDIPPVNTIFVVGFSGSGKSSLINLMYNILRQSGLIPFAQTSSGKLEVV